MARPAVFIDRDGTLIQDRGYLSRPDQVEFFPESVPALRRLQQRFVLFIVTNQSGVAKGLTSLEEVRGVNDHVVRRLAAGGVEIRDVYCCPHGPEDGCACRKPGLEFPRRARAEHGIDLAASFAVGDHPCDVELAAAFGGKGVFVRTGHGEHHVADLKVPCTVVPSIAEAAGIILGEGSEVPTWT